MELVAETTSQTMKLDFGQNPETLWRNCNKSVRNLQTVDRHAQIIDCSLHMTKRFGLGYTKPVFSSGLEKAE